MSAHLALLRGVNVGGNRKIAMADLRAFMTAIGYAGARTLLQSGNLVFDATGSPASLEQRLEREAATRLELRTDFFVRSARDWAAVIAANPFPAEAKADPSHLLVVALKDPVTPARVRALRAAIRGPERVEADGRHAYVVYPAGIGTSKLTAAVIDRCLETRGTARNWNTALKLFAMLEA